MRIGHVAKLSGASIRSIRHYEHVGLIRARRTRNGYRDFDPGTVSFVQRIRRMIGLGFTTEEIISFLPSIIDEGSLVTDCSAVTAAHRAKLEEIERKIADLETRRDDLLATLRTATGPCDPKKNRGKKA